MNEILVLRVVHILSGVFWAGATIFVVFFLEPLLRTAGTEGAHVMQRIAASRYPMVMTIAGILTIVTGLWMFQILMGQAPTFMGSGVGRTLSVGAVFALAGFTIGIAVTRPAAVRLGVLGREVATSGGPPTESQAVQLQKLRARLVTSSRWNAFLLTLAVACMAAARAVQ